MVLRTRSYLVPIGVDAGETLYRRYAVVGLGDSLTYGDADEAAGPYTPWLEQLSTFMEWRPTVNMGVAGETSTEILARWVAAPQYYDYTVINWSGRNDIGDFGTGWSTTTIANLDSFVAIQQAAGNSRYVLFGVTNSGAENPTIGGSGTTFYDEIVAHNAACATRYGDKFFDIREWMVNDALAAIGLTPTADDLADIALDMIPRQLRRDATNVHFNTAGNKAVAYKVAELVAAMDAASPVNVLTFRNLASLQGDGSLMAGEYVRAYKGLQLGDPILGFGTVVQGFPRKAIFMAGGGQEIPSNISGNALTSEWSFFGYGAGGTAFTGRGGTGVGTYALNNVTSGGFNTAIGGNAMKEATTTESNVAVGFDALRTLTTECSGNVAVGRYALYNYIGTTPNTSVGYQALYLATTGSRNTAVGNTTLRNTTTGNQNTGVGNLALTANTTGSNNVAIGSGTLAANTTASSNIGIGTAASAANIDGASNVAIGTSAMAAATTSGENVAIGHQVLLNSVDTAGKNNMIGFRAGRTNTTGSGNVGVGHSVLFTNSTGVNSVALGNSALYLATGSNNIAIGHSAGDNITTGARNIVIGQNVDAPVATGSNQLTIGNLIFGYDLDGTGTTASTGNVGIGGTPAGAGGTSAKLDIYGDKVRLRTSKTPSSAADAGNAGDICWDADYIYVATAASTWKRAALSTWP